MPNNSAHRRQGDGARLSAVSRTLIACAVFGAAFLVCSIALGLSAGIFFAALWLLAVLIAALVLIRRHILRPLRACIAALKEGEPLPEDGVYELRYLISNYNRVFRQNEEKHAPSFEAEHDPLTGLWNRAAFERLEKACAGRNTALLLIDIDFFATVNEEYGFETGDLVLKKVALLLRSLFRADDHICRIGGDNYAVLMQETTSALSDLVIHKLLTANIRLREDDADGLPIVSLSAGVAFPDRAESSGDLYRDAHEALHRVKNNGLGGVAIYGEDALRK